LNDNGAGFRHDTNKISIVSKEEIKEFPLRPKSEVATDIIDELEKRLKH
jgi:phosphopantothenoylcysteine decarboxylase/phosphopantothenate--cysteine ligase